MAPAQAKRQRLGINSLEVGLRLAKVLGEHGLPLALKDLAAKAAMPPAKAHRYLVSLIRAGLAEQDRESGRSRVQGDLLRGVASIAAPVFGHGGGIVAVVAALGPQGGFDVAWDGAIARAVQHAARELSARLGYRVK